MVCRKLLRPLRGKKVPVLLMFITSVLWRAGSPGICQVVILTQQEVGKPQQVWTPWLALLPSGKLSWLPHDPCISCLPFPLGGWSGRWGFMIWVLLGKDPKEDAFNPTTSRPENGVT